MKIVGLALLLATLASGCLPTTTTTRQTTARTLGKLEIDQAGAIELAVNRDVPQTLIVSATQAYRCRRDVVDDVQVNGTTKARLVGTSDGETWGWALLFPLVMVYPVGLANLALAGGAAILTPDTSKQEHRSETISASCRAPARTRIYVTLASGQQMDTVTDAQGIAAFVLPAGEDPQTVRVRNEPAAPEPVEEVIDGVAVTITPNASTTASPPPQPMASPAPAPMPPAPAPAGFGGIARVVRDCGATHHAKGTVYVTVAITAGRVTRVDVDNQDAAFTACVRNAAAAVTFEPSQTQTVRVPFKTDPGR